MEDVYTEFEGVNLKKRTLGTPRLTWGENIEVEFVEIGCSVWIGCVSLGAGTRGGLLCTR
jgi:hypothetical protein